MEHLKAKIVNRPCPICFSNSKDQIFNQKFNDGGQIFLVESYDISVCKKCGFVFADKIPRQESFNEYYGKMSKYEFNDRNSIVPQDYIEYYKKIVNFFTNNTKSKNLKILDIGCSTGGLLSILKSAGYKNLFGIDPSPTCIEAVKKIYGINASADDISSFSPKEKFDVVILSAVLEHLVDFRESMIKIQQLLNENGILLIEVPDVERFERYISAPLQQFSIEHINYFSKYSMRNLLGAYHFHCKKIIQGKSILNSVTEPDLVLLAELNFNKKYVLKKDNISARQVKKYISKSIKIDKSVQKTLMALFKRNDKVIVWGVGTHTQRLLGNGQLDKNKISFFVDSNRRYQGEKLNGIVIKAPEMIKEHYPIMISTYAYQDEIAKKIKDDLKLKNTIIKLY